MEAKEREALQAAMLRLADGDRTASRAVFEGLWPKLVAFATRSLGKGPDADDAAQDAMRRIFEQASDFDPERSVLAWALAICGWECRTVMARRRRRRETTLEVEAVDRHVAAALDDERAWMSGALENVLGALSPQDRATLSEAFFDSVAFIEMGAKSSAFRKRKERAVVRLRAAWRRLYGTGS